MGVWTQTEVLQVDRRTIFNKEDCGGVCVIGEVILMDSNDIYTSFRVKTVSSVFPLLIS